jgi:hypothetical protein
MDQPQSLSHTKWECKYRSFHGIGKVHRIPPVELKCLSEKRRGEITALVGGTKAARRG